MGFEKRTQVSVGDLERGDHIKRRLKFLPLADHHGIYLGNGKVAHFFHPPDENSGKDATKVKGSIRQDTFDRFADGFPVYRVPHWNLKKSKEQVAELAEKYATAEVWKRQYNFVFKNCAHFVHYCYGEETHVSILKKQLFNRTVILTNRTAAELLFGGIEVKTDGVGLHAKATAFRDKCTIAGVSIEKELGTAEAGIKLWELDVGLDLGVKANARIGSLTVGAVSAQWGPSWDTGIQIGTEGVGMTVLGVGGQIGKKSNVSLSTVKFGLDLT
uniref:LRAT domain-containing protein n=1 Tax=Panagrellus redivivus TaxID=6233 RepID=A0A7E4UYZ0_PANRE